VNTFRDECTGSAQTGAHIDRIFLSALGGWTTPALTFVHKPLYLRSKKVNEMTRIT